MYERKCWPRMLPQHRHGNHLAHFGRDVHELLYVSVQIRERVGLTNTCTPELSSAARGQDRSTPSKVFYIGHAETAYCVNTLQKRQAR